MRLTRLRPTTAIVLILSLLLFSSFGVSIQAADLTQRRVDIGSSEPLATTQYGVSFDVPGVSDLGSISILFCSNSPLVEDPCTPPTGFNALSASLINQTGETGFSIDGSSTANNIILTRSVQTTTATTLTYQFDDIVNPQSANTSYYARIATYETTDATGSVTDDGSVALSTAEQLNVTLYVPPYLEFCVGISILSQDCTTATGNQVNIGTLSTDQTATGISKFLAATNAPGGYTVQVAGSTMAAGNNVITRMSTTGTSNQGQRQFGINLRANTSPNVGLEPSGPGGAQPNPKYNQINNFAFASGDTVANAPTSNDRVTFTVSYIANVDDGLPPGRYSTTLTYICTGSF